MSISGESSSIFTGTVSHVRLKPTKHSFVTKLGCYFMPISGSEKEINKKLSKDNIKGTFRREVFFGNHKRDLDQSILQEASKINGSEIQGSVYLLGQIKNIGFYFSPVNFYFIKPELAHEYKYMLAEVTNTPWNEKHCYLVDLEKCDDQDKEFHVSPFNPMDMKYKWSVKANASSFYIYLGCYREDKEFEAILKLQKNPKKNRNYFLMNFKIVIGIYLHALILFIKKNPIYDHPKRRVSHGK